LPHVAIRDALRCFGVTDARIRRLPRGAVNDLWIVDAGGERHVLKRTHPNRLPEHTLREHEVLQFLGAHGWSVPQPLHADDGSTIVRLHDRTWWLAPWLPGRSPAISAASVARLGALLARLHEDLSPLNGLPPTTDSFGPRTILARTESATGWRFADAVVALERADRSRGVRLQREVERVTSALAAVTIGPTVLGHGDLHTGNLLVSRGTTSVLDFDFSHTMERAFDVATSVGLLDDQRLAPALVDGYGALSYDERAAVPLFFDARQLLHASWLTFLWSTGKTAPDELDGTFARLGTCGVGA
jgi:Ser/Thr protein kinase RdoA (MazF antagonist)